MPCAQRKVDVSQYWTAARPRTQILVEEEAALVFFEGWLPARKEIKKIRTSGRATTTAGSCPSKRMYLVIGWDYNKLLLRHLAVTASCCCSMLLYCGDESASRNKCGTVAPTWYFILHHHHQPRRRLWRCRTRHNMLQRVELITRLCYTFHSCWHGHFSKSILYSHLGVLTVAIVAASLQRHFNGY